MVVLGKLLRDRGYEVRIVTYFNDPFYEPYLIDNGVEYECISKASNKYLRIFRLFVYFKKYKPDIVISYLDTPNIFSIILHLIGLHYKLIVSERNTTQRLSLRELVKFFLYRYSDFIVPNSTTQTQLIKSHFPKLTYKIRMITNFIDTDFFCPSIQVLQQSAVLRLAVVGRIVQQKNTLKFIEAICKLKNKGLKIIVSWYGDNFYRDGKPTHESEYYHEAIKLVKQLDIEGYVNFYRPVKNVKDVYHAADVVCLPSIYEGFPNVICEAMACGKPVLAGNIGDNHLLVENGINGFLFDPASAESMARTIEDFYNLDTEERVRMGLNSRERVVMRFSKSSFVEKYIELIENN